MCARPTQFADLLIAAGLLLGAQSAMAEVGANKSVTIGQSQTESKDKDHKGHIEIQSYSLGATQDKGLELDSLKAGASESSKEPKTPTSNIKSTNDPKPAGLLVPAVQKVREAASRTEDSGKKK